MRIGRREFIVGATAMLGGSVLARPIRSGIAGYRILHEEEESIDLNPYVTSGLVAMWDAEWNVGFEEHSDDPAMWTDVSGNGHDLNLTDQNVVFSDWLASIPFSATIVSGTSEPVRCIEAVFGLTKTDPYFRGKIVHTGSTYGIISRYKWLSVRTTDVAASQMATDRDLTFAAYSFGIDFIYKNGVQQTTNRTSYTTQDVGSFGISLPASIRMTLANLRFYSRDLEPEEVAYNYSIDRARFGV